MSGVEGAQPPQEYIVDLVCQAFPGMPPSVARAELYETNPHGYIQRMLEYRNYAEVKRAVERADAAGTPDQAPTGALAEIVVLNQFRAMELEHGEEGDDDE